MIATEPGLALGLSLDGMLLLESMWCFPEVVVVERNPHSINKYGEHGLPSI